MTMSHEETVERACPIDDHIDCESCGGPICPHENDADSWLDCSTMGAIHSRCHDANVCQSQACWRFWD